MAVPQGETRHEKIFASGKHVRGAEQHSPLEVEAGAEEGFRESGGRQTLDGEVVLSKKHKEAACNAGRRRVRLGAEAGAGVVQPGWIHNHLWIVADLRQQQRPGGQRSQLGKTTQGSRGQTQMLHENYHPHDFGGRCCSGPLAVSAGHGSWCQNWHFPHRALALAEVFPQGTLGQGRKEKLGPPGAACGGGGGGAESGGRAAGNSSSAGDSARTLRTASAGGSRQVTSAGQGGRFPSQH